VPSVINASSAFAAADENIDVSATTDAAADSAIAAEPRGRRFC
jgi:hypothetical protein